MQQKESEVWKRVKKSLPPTYTATRVEARHPPGISDVIWSYLGDGPPSVSGFLELKDQEMEVRPEQGIFLRSMWSNGVPSAVLIRLKTELLLVPGGWIPLNNKLTMTQVTYRDSYASFDADRLWHNIRHTFNRTIS